MSIIKLFNINKSYKSSEWDIKIFDNLNFEIEKWDYISIMWTSWTGKTTLLNIISWLDSVNSGSVEINWIDITKLSEDQKTEFRWKNISFIFQSFNLIPNISVNDNIDLIIDINHIERKFDNDTILDYVWLLDKKNQYPFNLSWWEQQRVAIARAFVWDTPILLADEPTWNLDKNNSNKVMQIINDLHIKTWMTIILITHDKFIANMANRQYVLDDWILISNKS